MSARSAIDSPVHIRPPAVAGSFYPADPDSLDTEIRSHIHAVAPSVRRSARLNHAPVRAIIAPHAGYRYSGAVAASAYIFLEPLRGRINRVALIGPSHRFGFTGLACSSAEAFDTPSGAVPIDTTTTRQLTKTPGVHINDAAHAPEHGLEVQLPWLIHALSATHEPGCIGFSLIPLLFGEVDDAPVVEVLDGFFDDEKTLVVISSDLSHYLTYQAAAELDRETADAVVDLSADDITQERACGHTSVRALLRCAQSRGLRATEVDLRSSGDTAGPRDSVVGYGAFIFR